MSADGSGRGSVNAETERLSLRLLAASDEDLYCELYTDVATMRFIGAPLSQDRAERSFRKALQLTHRHPMEQLFLTIIDRATRQTVGICSIQQFDERTRRAEAGIILKPAVHTQGMGKEAFAALVTCGFEMFPIDEVRARISVDHSAAEGVLASIGFLRRGDIAPAQERPDNSIWSTYRESWCKR